MLITYPQAVISGPSLYRWIDTGVRAVIHAVEHRD